MRVNDMTLYDSLVFSVKWWDEKIKEEETSSPLIEPAKSRHIEWMRGKLEAYKDVLNELQHLRGYEAEQIEKEIKKMRIEESIKNLEVKDEDNEQAQSA